MDFLFQIGLLNITGGWAYAFSFALIILIVIAAASKYTGADTGIDPSDGWHSTEERNFYQHFLYKYPVWAMIQQLVVFMLLFAGRTYITDAWWMDIVIAIVFGVMHFPNWFLMLPTMGLALIFIQFMDQFHNLYAIGVVHGMLGTAYGRLSPKAIATSFTTWKNYAGHQKRLNKKISGGW